MRRTRNHRRPFIEEQIATTHLFDAVVTIGVRPTLRESTTAASDAGNFQRLPPLQHQQNPAKTIALYRVRLFGNQASEPARSVTLPFDDGLTDHYIRLTEKPE